MSKPKIIILGSTGMLGAQVARSLSHTNWDIVTTARDQLDAETITVDGLASILNGRTWCINCIGLIKPFIDDHNPIDVAKAITINALFPAKLAQAALRTGCRVIQIATDCVWDGNKGAYSETDAHTANDVYGRSKSLGEMTSQGFYNIRCSIIGREMKTHHSLLGWFLNQPANTVVKGFTNHHWNGVTTLQFAKLCQGIIQNDYDGAQNAHFIPQDTITKHDLLHLAARIFDRTDITIDPYEAPIPIDRTLTTTDPQHNKKLWQMAGYDQPPSFEGMLKSLKGEHT